MITTIIFDLGEVYLYGLFKAYEPLSKSLKISTEKIHNILQGEDLQIFFHGKISEDEYWKRIISKNQWKISIKDIKKIVRKSFKEVEGTREIIEELNKKGYKLGLLSVHTKEWVDHCEKKFDYHKLFHSKLYSFEVALCKPDKRVYELLLEKLKSKPKECLFIDDMIKNVEAAEELGIKAIQFKDAEHLKSELNKLKIL
jgi:epoxide hydrolase-like predicted phosphatase